MNCVDDKGNPTIIQKLVERLNDKEESLRTNIKSTLRNISELPLGYDKVMHELSDKIELLDEVFTGQGLVTLVGLLPKIDLYEDVLNLDKATFDKNQNYVDSINSLFKKYNENAAAVAINQTVNFVEKMFAYSNPNLETNEGTMNSLKEVC